MRRAKNVVRLAKRRDPERWRRIRTACGTIAADSISLDEHAALIVLDIEARVGRHSLNQKPAHADKEAV